MAAPLGFKTFATGDVLTAADTNGYLMQGVWTFADAAARDAAVTSPQEGNFCYLKDTNATQYYTGSAWTALGSGKVLQVVQATTTTATTVTSGSFTDTTLTASITPSSSSSKVLVMVSQYYKSTSAASGTAYGFQIKALRGATQIGGSYFDYLSGLAAGTYNKFGMWNFSYLDSPATTSSTTYKTQLRNEVGTVIAQVDSQNSYIILMEIGA